MDGRTYTAKRNTCESRHAAFVDLWCRLDEIAKDEIIQPFRRPKRESCLQYLERKARGGVAIRSNSSARLGLVATIAALFLTSAAIAAAPHQAKVPSIVDPYAVDALHRMGAADFL